MKTDGTESIEAVFIDAVKNLIGIHCKDLLMTRENKNPKVVPQEIQSLLEVPLLLAINIKPNETVGV